MNADANGAANIIEKEKTALIFDLSRVAKGVLTLSPEKLFCGGGLKIRSNLALKGVSAEEDFPAEPLSRCVVFAQNPRAFIYVGECQGLFNSLSSLIYLVRS